MNKEKGITTSGAGRSPAPLSENGQQQNTLVRLLGEVDRPFLIIVIILMCLGSVMVFSASYAYAQNVFDDSYYFAQKQIIWIVLGFAVMWLVAKMVRPFFVKKIAWIGYGVAILLNIAVLFLGDDVKGATRQITLLGVNFQPSEILKVFTVIVAAKYISDHSDKIKTFKGGILPFLLLALPSTFLFVMQSHLSATIINILIIFFMMILGGSNYIWLGAAGGVGAAAAMYVSTNIDVLLNSTIIQEKLSHVYRRLLVWKDPLKYMRDTLTEDAGWQPSQSLFAICSGGFWGVGLGKSIQKHGWLPEPQNDYIFAIICEELGFAGAIIIICLFAALIIRGFQIARRCKDKFSSLVVMGLLAKLGIQVVLNIAVVTNTIPSTGISLPFFSYGGTALLILLAEMGLILSISRYSYIEKG